MDLAHFSERFTQTDDKDMEEIWTDVTDEALLAETT